MDLQQFLHDSRAGRLHCDAALPNLPRVTDVLADQGFEPLIPGVGRRHHVTVGIKAWKPKPKPNGFKPLQPHWKVEDCFAQLGRWRRLARCFEATAGSATAWLQVACVGHLLTEV